MDVDRFLARHEPTWQRLAELTNAARRPGRMTAAETDELLTTYQQANMHLAEAHAAYRDAAVHQRLTILIAEAHAVIHGSRPRRRGAFARFVTRTFPGAVWTARRFIVVAALCTFVPAIALGTWMAHSDRALEASAPQSVRAAYVASEFEDYYSSAPAGQFATKVFINNVQVSILAFAAGVLGCVVTAGLLAYNGINLGFAAGLFVSAGKADKFFGLILPHGLLELSAVIVAGAAGLRLGWTVIAPGDRRRVDALAYEGRRSVVVVIGLIGAFGVAGLIEGFVTGSALPTPIRVGVGISVFVAFWSWIAINGTIAEREGNVGQLDDDPLADHSAPVAFISR